MEKLNEIGSKGKLLSGSWGIFSWGFGEISISFLVSKDPPGASDVVFGKGELFFPEVISLGFSKLNRFFV